jgi:hypothetical protein
MKTHWKKLVNPDYIGAYSLDEGKDLVVTIEKVLREVVTGQGGKKEECTVAYLKGQKPFILNNTNQKMIHKIHDTPYIEEWAGKSITLYVAKIKAFGEDNVEALRIRPVKPTLPELKPSDTANWTKVKQALLNGYNMKQVLTRWKISKDNQEQLLTEIA